MALILRRNEAERKKHGVKFLYYNTLFQFGMHATKGSTNFSISTPKHLILYISSFFVFLHLFSFLSAIKKPCFYRFGPKAGNSLYVLFFLYVLAWSSPRLGMQSIVDGIIFGLDYHVFFARPEETLNFIFLTFFESFLVSFLFLM
jgi:hypothetical protein